MLRRAARQVPADYRIRHATALMLLHTLSAGNPHAADHQAQWPACIGAWVAVLYDDGFWTDWRDRAQTRYAIPVTEQMVATAKSALSALIGRRVAAVATSEMPLPLLLRREEEAAHRSLMRHQYPGGPLHIAEAGQSRAACLVGSRSEHMRRLFSRAGLAVVELSADHPAEAVALALDLRCPDCQAMPTAIEASVGGWPLPVTCREGCPNFDRDNPVFAVCTDKHDALAVTGASVAVDALLSQATAAVSAREPDLALALRSWQHAVELAGAIGRTDYARAKVAETARGRADKLGFKDATGVDQAIGILDAALTPLDGNTELHGRVAADLAMRLNARGCRVANDNADDDPAKTESAVADLRRAVSLNPHLVIARTNLGHLLHGTAVARIKRGLLTDANSLLEQAAEQFEHARRERPADAELATALGATRENIHQIGLARTGQLRNEAVSLINQGRMMEGLPLLQKAADQFQDSLRSSPGDQDLSDSLRKTRQDLGRALHNAAMAEARKRDRGATLSHLRQAEEQFRLALREQPGDPELTAELSRTVIDIRTIERVSIMASRAGGYGAGVR